LALGATGATPSKVLLLAEAVHAGRAGGAIRAFDTCGGQAATADADLPWRTVFRAGAVRQLTFAFHTGFDCCTVTLAIAVSGPLCPALVVDADFIWRTGGHAGVTRQLTDAVHADFIRCTLAAVGAHGGPLCPAFAINADLL
jgi:hypothetical protein